MTGRERPARRDRGQSAACRSLDMGEGVRYVKVWVVKVEVVC